MLIVLTLEVFDDFSFDIALRSPLDFCNGYSGVRLLICDVVFKDYLGGDLWIQWDFFGF